MRHNVNVNVLVASNANVHTFGLYLFFLLRVVLASSGIDYDIKLWTPKHADTEFLSEKQQYISQVSLENLIVLTVCDYQHSILLSNLRYNFGL